MKVAIIGYGFVGKATEYFLTKGFDQGYRPFEIIISDPAKGYEVPNWSGIEYAFICVPTNLKGDKLDAIITELDKEKRKVSLSIKALEEKQTKEV